MAGRTVGPGHDIARIQHKFDDIWWEIPASLSVTSFGGGSERKPDRNPMTTAYRVLAFAIAAMVAIQVGAVGYAVFAQLNWIEKGGTVDEAACATGVPGTGAYMFHALFAGVVLLASLAMLVTSFFAKIPQGVMWAVIVLVCTVVQIALGTLSHMLAAIGVVHGAVALVLFGVAVMAAMRARRPAAVEEPVPAEVLQRPTTPIMAGRSTRVRLVVAAIDTLAVLRS